MDKSALLKSELIGLKVKVLGTRIEGGIVDETKNMLIIEHKGRKKRIIKSNNVFEFKGIKIDGKSLIGRSEERIKKTW
ncbi:ribonuclease P protein subunit [Candidatus Woesearchaeota archaeon]|nr:ribonuclease P protein subunit [Candidatus Woesearchaeota archaeon]